MWTHAVLYFVTRFAVTQIAKFGAATDWTKVKANWDVKVKELIPGEYFDEEAVALVNAVLDGAQAVCADSKDLQTILDLTSAKDWDGAAKALLELSHKTIGGKLASALLAA